MDPRRRDAARTRKALLDAASRRFAADGYASTTVRDIAEDAGVNVALINRYFGSKEGLFEACLMNLVEESRQEASTGPDRIAESIAGLIAGPKGDRGHREFLPLLLRRSGDERIDQLRVGFLRYYTERLATAAGWHPGAGDDGLLVRAQLVLAASIGAVVFRSAGLEPLATADEGDLVGPMRDLVDALLLRDTGPSAGE
ncbi:TetR/AcrR family transcriptional regulator [Virgisporangium ochraceum]|uniref:TetR family transcriptional regulator n=1 Tax=Virgisporangium ochraceum TaxID=65505 RepID=A0A8J3ZT27_9ACTN|nr:TetR/AcrR family transcriptional regulator [Virgisporangium ochraceum]GIJ66966.1 TetR family transcriptional regulator [Virgisporangium ochraceum]